MLDSGRKESGERGPEVPKSETGSIKTSPTPYEEDFAWARAECLAAASRLGVSRARVWNAIDRKVPFNVIHRGVLAVAEGRVPA